MKGEFGGALARLIFLSYAKVDKEKLGKKDGGKALKWLS